MGIAYPLVMRAAVSTDFIAHATSLTRENMGKFSPNGPGRRYWCYKRELDDPVLDAEKARLAKLFGLRDWVLDPTFTDLIGYITEGGEVHKHTDPSLPGRVHCRINVMVSKGEGGDPILDGTLLHVALGDAWVCIAGRQMHSTTAVTGDTPRSIVSYGLQVAESEMIDKIESCRQWAGRSKRTKIVTLVKRSEDGFVEVLPHQENIVDHNGTRHSPDVLRLWPDEEIGALGYYRAIDDEVPEGMVRTGAPRFEERTPGVVSRTWDLGPVFVPMERGDRINQILELTPEEAEKMRPEVLKLVHSDAMIEEAGAFGGIFIRTLTLENKGDYHQGHRHNYDHWTNLVQGAVRCEVDGQEPMEFRAPSRITIRADDWHKFTALEDHTIYQCIYRQQEREDLYTEAASPYGEAPFTREELEKRLKCIDSPCAHCACDDK